MTHLPDAPATAPDDQRHDVGPTEESWHTLLGGHRLRREVTSYTAPGDDLLRTETRYFVITAADGERCFGTWRAAQDWAFAHPRHATPTTVVFPDGTTDCATWDAGAQAYLIDEDQQP